MAAANADLTKDIAYKLEQLFLSGSIPIKTVRKFAATVTADPADFTAVANSSALTTATSTTTGVAVGDVVLGWGVVSGLAANQFVVAVYVSAANTITAIIGNALNTTVTTTAVTLNVIVGSF